MHSCFIKLNKMFPIMEAIFYFQRINILDIKTYNYKHYNVLLLYDPDISILTDQSKTYFTYCLNFICSQCENNKTHVRQSFLKLTRYWTTFLKCIMYFNRWFNKSNTSDDVLCFQGSRKDKKWYVGLHYTCYIYTFC